MTYEVEYTAGGVEETREFEDEDEAFRFAAFVGSWSEENEASVEEVEE